MQREVKEGEHVCCHTIGMGGRGSSGLLSNIPTNQSQSSDRAVFIHSFTHCLLGIWAKDFFINCLVVHDLGHAYSLASVHLPGLFDWWTLHLTKNCQNRVPTRAKKWFQWLFVLKRRETAQPVPTKAFLQPAKTAAMCTAHHDFAYPPPSVSLFLLVQNRMTCIMST